VPSGPVIAVPPAPLVPAPLAPAVPAELPSPPSPPSPPPPLAVPPTPPSPPAKRLPPEPATVITPSAPSPPAPGARNVFQKKIFHIAGQNCAAGGDDRQTTEVDRLALGSVAVKRVDHGASGGIADDDRHYHCVLGYGSYEDDAIEAAVGGRTTGAPNRCRGRRNRVTPELGHLA
jgi:hypothetical protein